MYKFFVESNQINNNKIYISGQDVNHIKNVLRMRIGDKICVCNKDDSKNYNCIIEEIGTNITCNICANIENNSETNTYIHIFQGLPKADKFEFIIEKCTEIGVKEITPIIMKRTVVKLEEKDKNKKLERWQKIAEVASKQSKRDIILKVNQIDNFKNIFNYMQNYDIVLLANENEKNVTLKQILKKQKEKINKIAVIIGPEGGIDEKEINICNSNGVNSITLGKRILRTETAPIVVSSNILYELEE